MWHCPSVDAGRQHFSFYVFPKLTSLSSTLEKCNSIFNMYQNMRSWSNIGYAFIFIFSSPFGSHYIELCFILNMNPCLFDTRCLQSIHSLRFTPVSRYQLSPSLHAPHSYNYSTITIFPLLSPLCPNCHHNGCAVGTGFGGLVSGTMQPFGATSCYSLHITTVSYTRHHCLSFQYCRNLNAQLNCFHFIKQNSVTWS